MNTHINEQSTFWEVDEALHLHERQYYSQAARDPWFRPERDLSPAWHAERKRLTELHRKRYAEKYPERVNLRPVRRPGIIRSIINAIKGDA